LILQIAHLTISTINFNDIIKNLTKLGYTTKLLEKNQKNLQIKKNFMTKFSSFHKLALLEFDKNFNIEIVQYEEINMKEQTFLIPSFHNSLIDDNKFIKNIENKKQEKNFLNDLKNLEFTDLKISTSDVEKSKIFWKKLGFLSQTENDSILNFNSLINNQTYSIELIEKPSNNAFLNDHGISCIAFLTNSITAEKKSFDDDGYLTTDIEFLNIGKNRIAVFFCKNDCGEIVEFIALNNK